MRGKAQTVDKFQHISEVVLRHSLDAARNNKNTADMSLRENV